MSYAIDVFASPVATKIKSNFSSILKIVNKAINHFRLFTAANENVNLKWKTFWQRSGSTESSFFRTNKIYLLFIKLLFKWLFSSCGMKNFLAIFQFFLNLTVYRSMKNAHFQFQFIVTKKQNKINLESTSANVLANCCFSNQTHFVSNYSHPCCNIEGAL